MKVDPNRYGNAAYHEATGIYTRAKNPDGKWDSVDIAELDEPSLTEFLTGRGGDNLWAENVVRIMLGWPTRTDSGERRAHSG